MRCRWGRTTHLVILCAAWAACAAEQNARPAETSPPYTYCIGYIAHPEAPEFLRDLGASPPDLYHLGYQIPFKGALGPTYGHDLFTNDILPPDQIPREVQRIEAIIAKMRAAGVRRLIPYVYTMAFFGDPDARTGFFHFYDHWDDYHSFGLGPKPAEDPSLWTQQSGPYPLDGAPPGVLHYNPCVNNPGWRDYLDLVVRQLATLDYDGMFFDVNTQYCYCPHCEEQFDIYLLGKYGRQGLRDCFETDDCRVLNLSTIYRDFEKVILEGFKTHLRAIWTQEHLAETLGLQEPERASLDEDWRLLRCYMQGSPGEFPPATDFNDYLKKQFGGTRVANVPVDQKSAFVQAVLRQHFLAYLQSPGLAQVLEQRFGSADIRRRCCGTPRDLLLWVETQRFWCDSMMELHARLKSDGQAEFDRKGRRDPFYTVGNLGSMVTVDGFNKRRVDGIDLVRWAQTSDMQMFEEMLQPGRLDSGVILSNIFAFRWAMAAGTRAGTLLYKATDDVAADLAEAEAAAGGGGAFIQAGLSAPESRRRWRRFFADHADLWNGGRSYAKVGVLFWNDQVFYEHPDHLAAVHRLVHVFAENQVPFDLVTEGSLDALPQYRVIIAPMLRYLDDSQVDQLLSYADIGGNLVIIHPFGTEDKQTRVRSTDPLANVTPSFQCARRGIGHVLQLEPEDVPARLSDQWCLMEERASNFLRARAYLDAARRADLERGVDLGSGFTGRLETALDLRLRWCPPSTDPAVYVHAYRIPSNAGRPDRIVVHAINYHVPIVVTKMPEKSTNPDADAATKAGMPHDARDVLITAPLPPNATVARVESFSPSEPPRHVHWVAKENGVTLTIDRLHIYQAITIELAP